MRKTICLMTDWYPTSENPYVGLFFKEQAFAVKDEFDFIVLRYKEHVTLSPFWKSRLKQINKELNTIEYACDSYCPLWINLCDLFFNFKKKKRIGTADGSGRYVSKLYLYSKKKKFQSIFHAEELETIDVFYCVDAQREAVNIKMASEILQKPYVVGEHAPVPWPGSVISDAQKRAIECADGFLAISHDKIRQLLLLNIKLPTITYIGNLIDETCLKIAPKPVNHIKTFIIVAAHSYYKNYDLFISVMNRLVEISSKDFKVMIVGYAANKGYSQRVDEFENKINKSKFADRVIMIPEVPHEEIGTTLNKADAFVMTSIQEGQPVSAMEAACCGLPIFSTRCGGVEDYVDDQMGRIYSVMDFEGMAQGLNNYLEGNITFNPEHIRDQAIRQFGRMVFAEKFTNIFNEVIQCHDAGVKT